MPPSDNGRSRGAAALLRSARRRLPFHALVIFVVWPLITVYSATVAVKEQSIFLFFTWTRVFLGSLFASLLLAVEFLVVGAILAAVSILIFTLAGREGPLRWQVLVAEPVLLFLAVALGIALEFPVVLRHPLFMTLRFVSVGTATLLLAMGVAIAAAAVGRETGGRRGAIVLVALVAGIVAASYALARPADAPGDKAPSNSIVLFGIDSLSQSQDVAPLRNLVATRGGAWYEKPVPPALITNTVWASIIMHRPNSEVGLLLFHQQPDWASAPFNLVSAAEAKGYETWAFFSDQSSMSVGVDAGFDVNRSGPVGWLQVATSTIKDASILLPVLLSRLPEFPLAMTPPNQSGTYAFDVRREIREVLTAGRGDRPVFVAAHLDYLHQPRFPGFSELTAEQRRAVRRTRVSEIRDPSFDPSYPKLEADVLDLYGWKLRNLQQMVREEIERSGFLSPERRNRLVLFSDHGDRSGISLQNFGEARYHHVVLATFGIPPRDTSRPISLLDLGEMVGLEDPARGGPAEPVVEFTKLQTGEYRELTTTSRLLPTGKIALKPELLERVGRRMRAYRPWDAVPRYESRPTRPAGQPAAVAGEKSAPGR